MKHRKLGLATYILGGALLAAGVGLLIAYLGFTTSEEEKIPALLFSGLPMAAIGLVLLPVGYFVSTRAPKSLRLRFEKYAALPMRDVADFAAELAAMRTSFAAEKDPSSNRFFIRLFAGSSYVSDFDVLTRGKVVWGYLVQANGTLYQNKRIDMLPVPAVVLYSPDNSFDADPLALREIAKRLSSGREGDFLRNESAFFTNRRLSDALTEGKEVYASCIMVYRPHLPTYMATDALMPVVASPSERSVFALNFKYWTKNFACYYVNGGSHERHV